MTTYIILRKTGDGLQGAELAAIIEGREPDEAEKAIAEGATKGTGSYVAIPFEEDDAVAKDVRATVELTDPPDPPEEAEAESESGESP